MQDLQTYGNHAGIRPASYTFPDTGIDRYFISGDRAGAVVPREIDVTQLSAEASGVPDQPHFICMALVRS